jgi:putative transcriptional regulator
MKNNFRLIGQRIRELREEKGWSQEELASRLRVTGSYINDLEHGRQKPGNVMCFSLSDVFCVPVPDIYPDIDIDLEKGREFLKE